MFSHAANAPKCPDETTGHIILCPNKDQTTLYNKSVQELVKWMHSVQTSPILIRMIGKYLDARNTMSMVDTLNDVEQETTDLELELVKTMTALVGRTLPREEYPSYTWNTSGGTTRLLKTAGDMQLHGKLD